MTNYISKTSLFDCPVTIAGAKSEKTLAACCAKNVSSVLFYVLLMHQAYNTKYTMVTPSMVIYHCRQSELLNIQVSSQNPDVVEQFIDAIDV